MRARTLQLQKHTEKSETVQQITELFSRISRNSALLVNRTDRRHEHHLRISDANQIDFGPGGVGVGG